MISATVTLNTETNESPFNCKNSLSTQATSSSTNARRGNGSTFLLELRVNISF